MRQTILALLTVALLFPLRSAAQDITAARVVVAEGNVSVLRSEQLWALFAGSDVHVGETILTREDGYAYLQVADGSTFEVFPNSHVVFRKNPASLGDLLDVFLGQIRVHIQRLGGEPNPNRIYTPTAVISVRGTTFDVSVDESETTVVYVEEGLVGVRHRLLPSNDDNELGAGDSITVYASQPLARARVEKDALARVLGNVARAAARVWDRNRGQGGGGSGGGSPTPNPPLPGDEEAPEPPPPPPPPPQ